MFRSHMLQLDGLLQFCRLPKSERTCKFDRLESNRACLAREMSYCFVQSSPNRDNMPFTRMVSDPTKHSGLAHQPLTSNYEGKRDLQSSTTSSVEFNCPTPSSMENDDQQELQGQTRATEGPLLDSTQNTPSASHIGGCYVRLTCSSLNI
ncbi:hypothetical protein TNCV_462521 [Trichonephila clavipes]|nr:hypothetical protein TNCV_462521 [Trichonephila clavipes]